MKQADHLRVLRERARAREPVVATALTPAQRAADAIAAVVGSWRFVIVQTVLLLGWLIFNAAAARPVDPYPFILLNLMLSFQAAYTAPIIMMSQNRQSEIDRQRSVADYDINRKAELEIETLHEKVDLLREQEIARLTQTMDRLVALLEAKG